MVLPTSPIDVDEQFPYKLSIFREKNKLSSESPILSLMLSSTWFPAACIIQRLMCPTPRPFLISSSGTTMLTSSGAISGTRLDSSTRSRPSLQT